jgi:phosphatidylinositol N-acetylglucosaminyltransferase subunit Q
MHPFSILTLGIFVAGYITARWDLVTRVCELAVFAWDNGVIVSFDARFSLAGQLWLTEPVELYTHSHAPPKVSAY